MLRLKVETKKESSLESKKTNSLDKQKMRRTNKEQPMKPRLMIWITTSRVIIIILYIYVNIGQQQSILELNSSILSLKEVVAQKSDVENQL